MKRAFKTLLMSFGLLLALTASAHAQAQVDIKPAAQADTTLNLMEEFESALAQDSISPSRSTLGLSTKYNTALTEFHISSLQHRRRVFDWQHTSSIIIFWVVIIIVFIGLIFSGIQFYISMQTSLTGKQAQSADATSNPSPEVAEFEASLQGVKVKSSVLGIIILAISLAFFYLYLAHVYPISEVGEEPKASATP